MKIRTLILAGLFAAAMAAQGAVTIVPSGVSDGSLYRLVFVTSITRDARSTNIADYNTFVNDAASINSNLDEFAGTWKAMASTVAVNVRDNTSTTGDGTGIAIYTLDGTRIADDYADLWDGGLVNPLWFTEQGNVLDTAVWTGSSSSGGTFANNELGAVDGTGEYGQSRRTDDEGVTAAKYWMARFNASPSGDTTNLYSLYAISEVLTKPPQGTMISIH